MAFIVDIRRGNTQLHLMYKAVFELSADRADFVSRLFSLKRPAGLAASRLRRDFTAYKDPSLRSDELYKKNPGELTSSSRRATSVFRRTTSGQSRPCARPSTRAGSTSTTSHAGKPGSIPAYAELMVATDPTGWRAAIWPRKRTSADRGSAQPKPDRPACGQLRRGENDSRGG